MSLKIAAQIKELQQEIALLKKELGYLKHQVYEAEGLIINHTEQLNKLSTRKKPGPKRVN